MRLHHSFFLSLLFVTTITTPLWAITLDTFEGLQSATSFGNNTNPGATATSIRTNANALGGTRALDTTSTSGNPALDITASTTATSPFYFNIAQDPSITGITHLHYDGDLNPSTVDFDGLGGIDLAEDGGTAFLLKDLFFDYPDAKPASISIRVYDASDATGGTYSDYELVLNRAYNFEEVAFDFTAPTGMGPNGAASINNVGALVLTVDGFNPAADIIMSTFSTNGPCPLTPGVGGRVLDDCGECIPPSSPDYNQSCVDCVGVPNGTTLPGTTCETNELGPCKPGIYDNDCSCRRVNNPTVEICDGADNNCNGEIDETYPQIGGTCGISKGDCQVSGVYICDDIGGVKCDIDFSQANLSDCDIEIGCDGIPGSGTKPDGCGICGGDGTSCENLECESADISSLLFQLDGGAKEQEALVRSLTGIIKRKTRKKRIREYVEAVRVDAHSRQIANWQLSWTLPIISVQCESVAAAELCVFNDNGIIVNNYIRGSEGLRDLGLDAVKRLKKVTRNSKLVKRWRKRLHNRHTTNLEIAAQVPASQAVCTALSSSE
ncbi:MAG: hypothetical protein KDD70_12090 [Bdellovibrionales bacterium]|nr:hypothetical protein [Bdellovibrionales bacterium]